MKTKSLLSFMVAALSLLLALSSCEKNIPLPFIPDTNTSFRAMEPPAVAQTMPETACPNLIQDELPGLWNYSSYKLGGVEYMGTLIKSASIHFSPYLLEQGTFVQKFNFNNGETSIISGPYEVNETEGVLTMHSGSRVTVTKITIHNGLSLVWTGTQNELSLVAQANRQ